jgi:hypothetical protein
MLNLKDFIWLVSRNIGINRSKNQIYRLKHEKIAVTQLMKQAQRDRFQTGKLSGLVYNIRMGKYKDRLTHIKQNLPVLEAELRIRKKGLRKKSLKK